MVNATVQLSAAHDLHSKELELLLIAAWFHDIGYDEGPLGHEERSGHYAKVFLEKYDFEEADITWPIDYEAMTCGIGLKPENLLSPYNEPVLDEGNCNNVAVGHTDQILEFGGANACLKILRKWHVVDWCQAANNPDPTQPGPGIWHYTQVLKIINSSAPTITSFNGAATIDNYEADCGSTTATFEIMADDDCTDQSLLEYSWEFSTGLSGTGNSASGDFLNGNYSLTFTVNDQCGNSVWQIHDFVVKDAKLPTPICLFGIATVVMPSSGAVTIWASDFEEGSSYDTVSYTHLTLPTICSV